MIQCILTIRKCATVLPVITCVPSLGNRRRSSEGERAGTISQRIIARDRVTGRKRWVSRRTSRDHLIPAQSPASDCCVPVIGDGDSPRATTRSSAARFTSPARLDSGLGLLPRASSRVNVNARFYVASYILYTYVMYVHSYVFTYLRTRVCSHLSFRLPTSFLYREDSDGAGRSADSRVRVPLKPGAPLHRAPRVLLTPVEPPAVLNHAHIVIFLDL